MNAWASWIRVSCVSMSGPSDRAVGVHGGGVSDKAKKGEEEEGQAADEEEEAKHEEGEGHHLWKLVSCMYMKELSTHMADVSEWYGRDDVYICWTVRMGGKQHVLCRIAGRGAARSHFHGNWEEGIGKRVLGRGYWEEGIGKRVLGKKVMGSGWANRPVECM